MVIRKFEIYNSTLEVEYVNIGGTMEKKRWRPPLNNEISSFLYLF